jgi:hypothetical protein
MTFSATIKSVFRAYLCTLLLAGCDGYSSGSIAARCERRIEATVDPVALQSWAMNLLATYSIVKTNYGGPFAPYPGLKNIWEDAPPSVCILGGDTQGEEFVCVIWGAAAGRWGLSIGKPAFVPSMPARGGRMWKPGIYFWRDPH